MYISFEQAKIELAIRILKKDRIAKLYTLDMKNSIAIANELNLPGSELYSTGDHQEKGLQGFSILLISGR